MVPSKRDGDSDGVVCETASAASPQPTATTKLSIDPGTYRVGADIAPGVYAGLTGTDVLDWCTWQRLSGVSGDLDDVLAIDIAEGQFYVEIQPTDKYFEIGCEITPIEDWPAPAQPLTAIGPGTYLVGRDIAPGTYRGKAGSDITDWCTWQRLSGVSGDLDDVLAIDIAEGQFFVDVQTSDYALTTDCELALTQ